MPTTPDEVLHFWLTEIGPEGWYSVKDHVDEACRTRFGETWQLAHDGELEHWRTSPEGVLAYLIVTDQLPRNMFRDEARAFATDAQALAAAVAAHDRGWDVKIAEPQRQFFYLPFMHSEVLTDQDHGVCLIKRNMPETGASNLLHARAHRQVIRRFGRFPHRNEALGRTTRAPEAGFLAAGGYGAVVRELEAEEAA